MAFMDFLMGESPLDEQRKRIKRGVSGVNSAIGEIPSFYRQYMGLMQPGIEASAQSMELAAGARTRQQQAAIARMLGSGGAIWGQAMGSANQMGAALAGRTLRQQANMDVLNMAQRTGLGKAGAIAGLYGQPVAPGRQGVFGMLKDTAYGAGSMMAGYGAMRGGNVTTPTAPAM